MRRAEKTGISRCKEPKDRKPCIIRSRLRIGIKRVVIGENKTFGGNENLLRERGLEVVIADDPDCIALMTKFINEKPEL